MSIENRLTRPTLFWIFILFLSLALAISCSQNDETFADYIEEGIDQETEEPITDSPGTDEDPILDDVVSSELRAFPTAVGFGQEATGGRGGKVLKVTNLNDSGPGSFREAVEADGPRIIVFEIGGTIFLNSEIKVVNDDITIAGQSAPSSSGGITIAGGSVRFFANNVIVRYMRFRLGDGGYKDANGNIVGPDGPDSDALALNGASGGGNMIFDHCSISWGVDENIGISGSSTRALENITFQNCIVSEGLSDSHHAKGPHSKGTLLYVNVHNITFYQNLFAHNKERNVRCNAGNSFEMINNIVYNYGYATGVSTGAEFSVIGNYYREGLNGASASAPDLISYISDTNYAVSDTKAFISNNTFDQSTSKDRTRIFADFYSNILLNSPIISSGIKDIADPLFVMDNILLDVGANYPMMDDVDQRVINDFRNGTGKWIDTQAQVGGYPDLAKGTKATDTDKDGMPDAWETAMGLNPATDDSSGDKDDDGYTNIEEYLNSLVIGN